MYRFSAALVGSVYATLDETSLMQGLKPVQDVTQRNDKSKSIASLMSTATSMLKNGATPDVVEFAQATLTEITSVVLPAITDAHSVDQTLVDHTFAMFEAALVALEQGTQVVKTLSDEERRHSQLHKTCRAEEETVCYTKRECDYDIYAIWRRFIEEETLLRELSGHVETHFCAPDVNGTLQIFRDGAVVLFPPWLEQKPVVETVEVEYGVKHPECETKFITLDEKTATCDAHQTNLESAACTHTHMVNTIREEFSIAWDLAISTYQHVVDEVHCLELDRWKEWRTLSTVQCLLDRTTERNGRPCDETTDEVVDEVTHCEQVQYDTSIDHLRITYYVIPVIPPFCVATPWDISMSNPGRCVPQVPESPCSAEYFAQEYAELWIPPQPEFWGGVNFEEGNSHCNQRQDCVVCAVEPEIETCTYVFDGFGNEDFILPEPEHECHSATRVQISHGIWTDVAPDAATCQIPVGVWHRSDGLVSLHYDGENAFATQSSSKQIWSGSAYCDDESDEIVFTFRGHALTYAMSNNRRTLTYSTGWEYVMA
jgi:hypothetical protein